MLSVKDSYNCVSDAWAAIRDKKPVNKCIVDFANGLSAGARVLDVGCGTGYPIAAYLSSRGFYVRGIDLSENMIKKAEALKLSNASFAVCDFLDYPLIEEYDAIIAFDSIWHIELARQRDAFKKAAALLKSGGMFLFTYGKDEGEIVGSMLGENFYYSCIGAEKVKACLAENGFDVLEFVLNYAEETTGTRDLFAVARKR